jgi:hypothetical protein
MCNDLQIVDELVMFVSTILEMKTPLTMMMIMQTASNASMTHLKTVFFGRRPVAIFFVTPEIHVALTRQWMMNIPPSASPPTSWNVGEMARYEYINASKTSMIPSRNTFADVFDFMVPSDFFLLV